MAALTWDQAMAKYNPSATPLNIGSALVPQDTGLSTDGGYIDTGTYGNVGNGSGGTVAPAVDHTYDAWGGKTGYTNAVNTIDSGLNNVRSSGTDAFGNARSALQGVAQNSFNGIRDTQTDIDNGRNNNELSRMNSIQDILGYVRQGLQQGGSRLAANNATESSATGALQRAYQQLGSQKSRSVNNQAGLKSAELDQNQAKLGQHIQDTIGDFHRQRDDQVATIGSQIRQQLAALDQQAIGLNLPGRIAVDQEKQRLIDAGMGQLQQVDQWLQDQVGGVHAESQDDMRARAAALQQVGTASTNPFNVAFNQQQVEGPAISDLPLFTRTKRTS